VELRQYIQPLLKWWWMLLAATLIAAISTLVVTLQQTPMYQSRATLVVGQTYFQANPTSTDIWQSQSLAAWYVDLAQRQPVQQATMEALGISWLPSYTARTLPNTQLIEIVVTDSIPERAQIVANELANQVIRQSPTFQQEDQERDEFIQEQLRKLEVDITLTNEEIANKQEELGGLFSARQIADAQTEIRALETKLSSLQSTYASLLGNTNRGATNTLSIIEGANLPTTPVGPQRIMLILISAAVGLVLAIAAAYLLEYLDDTIKTSADVNKLLKLPVIGQIAEIDKGKIDGAYIANNPRSAVAEAYRGLRTNLEFAAVDRPLKVILVSSAAVGDGKTSVAISLATIMAQGGKTVLLVDGDLRRPRIHNFLGLPNTNGLTDVFRNSIELHEALQTSKLDKVMVIPAGEPPPNPSELLGSKKMDIILDSLRKVADVVILDGPPFLVTDAALLSSKVDGVLLVVRSGLSRKNEVFYAIEQLDRVGARVLGVALNGIQRSTDTIYSRYHSYGSDYFSESMANGKTGKELPKGKMALFNLFGSKRKRAEIASPAKNPGQQKESAETARSLKGRDGEKVTLSSLEGRKLPPK
jgi:succinoglycan biosynthesis transport protein ExoP